MKKRYLIFDLDGTLTPSQSSNEEIILNVLSKVECTDLEKAKYIFHKYTGLPVLDQIEMLYEDDDGVDHEEVTQKIYEELDKSSASIYPGVDNFLKKLSKDFMLFLSTGSSDNFAKKTLKDAGIYDLFEAVMGSTTLLKGPKHIETFEMVTQDRDFYQKTVYIGDGEGDRMIAEEAGLPFIKIGKTGENRYEADSVLDIEELIKKAK